MTILTINTEDEAKHNGNTSRRPIPESKKCILTVTDDDDDDELEVLAVKKVSPTLPLKNSKKSHIVDLTQDPPSPIILSKFIPPNSAGRPSAVKCAICLGEVTHPTSTICGHIFCESCIKLAIRQTKICPTCRKPLNNKQIHRIYL